ncbi:transposase [Candidatus Sumerlaeota bacterium]|nr:transposase [Candidatus Sumerlaeota bacterium]
MARLARAVIAGIAYHVTHRGNHRGDVFFSDDDRERYGWEISQAAARYGLEVWAYCWMRNHVHLIVVPTAQNSLARAIGRAHGRYSRWINIQRGWTGHLWANRFYSCALDGPHLWKAVKYVELNPVRAGLAERAEDWPWSSARAHVLGEPDAILSPKRPFPGEIEDWAGWLHEGLSDGEIEALRRHTQTGRPLGDIGFIERLESFLGRLLRPGKRGRKSKADGK